MHIPVTNMREMKGKIVKNDEKKLQEHWKKHPYMNFI